MLDTQRVDGTVLHYVQHPVEEGANVELQLDWRRRYDHMQMHTGELPMHSTSAPLFAMLDASTVQLSSSSSMQGLTPSFQFLPRC